MFAHITPIEKLLSLLLVALVLYLSQKSYSNLSTKYCFGFFRDFSETMRKPGEAYVSELMENYFAYMFLLDSEEHILLLTVLAFITISILCTPARHPVIKG